MSKKTEVSEMFIPDELHEECGVFGIYDFDGNDVASTLSLIHI